RAALKKELGAKESKLDLLGLSFRGSLGMGLKSWGDLYYLWSLERVGVIFNLKTIGGKDWYAWGAPIIVDAQRPDAAGSGRHPGIPDTCFALLFLKRHHLSPNLTEFLKRRPLADLARTPITKSPNSK